VQKKLLALRLGQSAISQLQSGVKMEKPVLYLTARDRLNQAEKERQNSDCRSDSDGANARNEREQARWLGTPLGRKCPPFFNFRFGAPKKARKFKAASLKRKAKAKV